jgi:hypothetical protein
MPDPAIQTAARKIYNKYLAFFGDDRDAAKAAVAVITTRPSKEWTAFTIEDLENNLRKLENHATEAAIAAEAGKARTAAEEEAAAFI